MGSWNGIGEVELQMGGDEVDSWVSYGLGTMNENLPTFVVLVAEPNNKETIQAISGRVCIGYALIRFMQIHNSERKISKVLFLEADKKNKQHFADIVLKSNEIQRPTYSALRRHISLPRPEEWEYKSYSTVSHYVVFCFSWASFQGGVIAVWNTASRQWSHYSYTEYAVSAMLVPDCDAIISFHWVSNYATPPRHSVDVMRFRNPSVSTEIAFKKRLCGFNPAKEKILQEAYGIYIKNKFGPLGIFRYSNAETFCAHDCGNFLSFTSDDIRNALR